MKEEAKLTIFQQLAVQFIETMEVKEGVRCDVYQFVDDNSKDLAIVTVQKGYKTPLQRILLGTKTIEGFVDGKGSLTINRNSNDQTSYQFPGAEIEVTVAIGQTMQWQASDEADLVFYEICEPPYKDGRFENLAD